MKSYQTIYSIKIIAKFFALAIVISGFALVAFAAPPVNDNFASPVGLTGSGVNTGTNVQATREAGEPSHALNRGAQSVWYKYIATDTGVLTVNTIGSSFDTLLAVYSGNSVNNLKLFAASDDIDPATFQSQVVIGIQSGNVYYIAVDGFRGNAGIASGSVVLNYSVSSVVPNDNFANAVQLPGAKGRVTTTNIGASKEAGEPSHANNDGGKSVWFKWTAPAGSSKSYTFTVQSLDPIGFGSVTTLMAIYTGASVNSLVRVTKRIVFGATVLNTGKLILIPTPGVTYYIALDGFYNPNNSSAEVGTFKLSYDITRSDKVADFDRDGKADISVYRPTTGAWYSLESITDNFRAYSWGTNGDKPLFSDFSEKGTPSYSVFRPNVGSWYIKDQTASNEYQAFQWGANTDIPLMLKDRLVNGNTFGEVFNTYAAVFRPLSGTWYINSGGGGTGIAFGQFGDVPVAADFDGDGNDELAVFRPSNGTWYILNRKTNQYQGVQFGQSGDEPVAADYDADGKTDIAVYRPSNGAWYVLRSSDGQFQAALFGTSTDLPQPADYDGDGKADYAVFRPSNGTWYLQQSSAGFKAVAFGAGNDIPVTAPNPLP